MDELGLQLLQPRLGFLPLGQVADEAGEEAPVAGVASRRPTSSIGKVEPSLRSPTTTRPMPMMRRSPVRR